MSYTVLPSTDSEAVREFVRAFVNSIGANAAVAGYQLYQLDENPPEAAPELDPAPASLHQVVTYCEDFGGDELGIAAFVQRLSDHAEPGYMSFEEALKFANAKPYNGGRGE